MTNSPISPRSGTLRVGVLLGALALLVLAYLIGSNFNLIPGNWSFTKDVHQFEGRFFRMIVKLEYQGESQTFDFVVGCQVKSISYQDGSRSRDVGFIPAVYGRRMKDNKAVVIRPPDVCNGETTTGGEVPPAFMPLIVVYDNADTLDQGLAYMSDDAYESPLSDMKFGIAEIIASNQQEFETFMEKGVPNLFTREKYWSAQHDSVVLAHGLKPIRPNYSKRCEFVQRFRLPDALRQRARSAWPMDKPKYWYAKNLEQSEWIISNLFDGGVNEKDKSFWMQTEMGGGQALPAQWFRHSAYDFGMARRVVEDWIHPTPFGRRTKDRPLIAYYPVWSELAQRYWPKDVAQWPDFIASLSDPIVRKIELDGGEKRGFAACWSYKYEDLKDEDVKKFSRAKGHAVVDGERVYSQLELFQGAFQSPLYMFERDEFIYLFNNFDFGVMGGDVK